MKRRGNMLVEMAAATVLLAAVMATCVELLAASSTQRRAAAEHQLAAQEAANLMERLAAMPLADLRLEKVHDLPLSPEGKRLRGVQTQIEVDDEDGPPRAVRVAVSIRWEDRNGQLLAPVRLVAWRYQ